MTKTPSMKRSAILKKYAPLSTKYKGADLSAHDLTDWVFLGADMRGCNLEGAYGDGVDFRNCLLDRANLTRVNLTNSTAIGASFRNAGIIDAIFHNVKINAADLRGCEIRRFDTDAMGSHTRGVLIRDFDPAQITGPAHDCHDLVAAMLRVEFPHDLEITQIAECIIARYIPCWHGLVERVRNTIPHRIPDLVGVFEQYNDAWMLADRWALGEAMADAHTQNDWEEMRKSRHYDLFPGFVDRWYARARKENGWD